MRQVQTQLAFKRSERWNIGIIHVTPKTHLWLIETKYNPFVLCTLLFTQTMCCLTNKSGIGPYMHLAMHFRLWAIDHSKGWGPLVSITVWKVPLYISSAAQSSQVSQVYLYCLPPGICTQTGSYYIRSTFLRLATNQNETNQQYSRNQLPCHFITL